MFDAAPEAVEEERGDATSVLRLRRIAVRHGRKMTLTVPELDVAPGEVVALIGPNGAGKSTLLHVAALLRRPDEGAILIGGEPATRRTARALRRRIAVVFQDPLLFDRGVLANAASGLRFRGVARAEAERRAAAWLDRFGVGHLAGRGARSLSGGEAQRVALARAFAVDPDLLLLDEPFAPLDAPTRAALVPELAARLRETGTAALVVTHDLTEALALGDRLGVLLGGRIAQLGPPDLVLRHPATAAVAAFLGIANVLPGRVVTDFGDGVTVALRDGPIVVVAPPGRVVVSGERVGIALAAPEISVLPIGQAAPPGWNRLEGVVVGNSPTAFGRHIGVDAGVRLTAAVAGAGVYPAWAPGDPVVAAFPPAAAHLVPDDLRR